MGVISGLNKAFENRVRLGVMSLLLVNQDGMDFNELKAQLDVTDGNLASHINGLEKMKYINIHKQFIGKKPNTTYTVTNSGKAAFVSHLNALENLLKQNKN